MSPKNLSSWLNAQLIPQETELKKKHGLYADFYSNGQLKTFGIFNKKRPASWILELKENEESGCATFHRDSLIANEERYEKGIATEHNYSSDSPGDEVPFEPWVKKWIEKIHKAFLKEVEQKIQAHSTREAIAKHGKNAIVRPVKK